MGTQSSSSEGFADGGHIDPELVPYLQAADSPEEGLGDQDVEDLERQAQADEKDLEDLRNLVQTHILGTGDLDSQLFDDLSSPEVREEDLDVDSPVSVAQEAMAYTQAMIHDVERSELEDAFNSVYSKILERVPEHQIDPTLFRVEQALDILGNPQTLFDTVHVTGTNGKTSTARMVERLLLELGYSTGRFTSPHLSDPCERLVFNAQQITHQGFVDAWNDVAPYIEMADEISFRAGGPRLSFFEIFTVMAFAAFADAPVDAAVVEVGMGGRWDATNVVRSSVQIITPISREHEKWLGTGIEAIATEKAGIIKEAGTVVVAKQPLEALEVIARAAQEANAKLIREGEDFEILRRQKAVGGQVITLRTPQAIYEDIFVPLHGEYQAQNAACALVAVEAYVGDKALNGASVETAFAGVTSPGRLEVVRNSPMIVADATHNPGGAAVLREALEDAFEWHRTIGLFAVMRDKDVEGILGEMEPVLDELIVTSMNTDRAMPPEEAARIAEEVFGEGRVHCEPNLLSALDLASGLAEEAEEIPGTTGVIAFGSVFLSGEVREMCKGSRSLQ
ncbi:MAG: folylpolyglutamate synthase/dihydrofolate synthase family protein [Actinomycetaceae bacterium]|nr:folylpolyglutamate synthase/dihydrofolate synthase family protein [Actinomycetaceae bacterium]